MNLDSPFFPHILLCWSPSLPFHVSLCFPILYPSLLSLHHIFRSDPPLLYVFDRSLVSIAAIKPCVYHKLVSIAFSLSTFCFPRCHLPGLHHMQGLFLFVRGLNIFIQIFSSLFACGNNFLSGIKPQFCSLGTT